VKDRVHFPGLDGLRFFAAMAVAVSHVELLKQYHGFPNHYDHPAVYELGRLSVTLFFVLSGYLITYLLLAERKVSGNISVGKFYIRRVLRIWPLYYLVVLLAFFLFPHLGVMHVPAYTDALAGTFSRTFPLFLFFLPQVALSIYDPVPFAEPLWSIGVEEQFYLLWPLLIRRFRGFVTVAVVVIVAMLAFRHGAIAMAKANAADPERLRTWNGVINYFYFTRMECMAIGGLFGWLVFARKKGILSFFYNRAVQLAVYALTLWMIVKPASPVFDYGVYAALFGILILNVSTNDRSLIRLGARPFRFLGNISFSIYMFHEVAIQLTMAGLRSATGTTFEGLGPNVALYAISLALTVLIASASYLGFERWFLRKKTKFAVIET
jgi:peptidoglycan/LPS O-acetylase OafA/YrhL